MFSEDSYVMQNLVFMQGKGKEISDYRSFLECIINLKVNQKIYSFMTGVLLADIRRTNVEENFLRYISDYNDIIGDYIDILLPGYVTLEEKNNTILLREHTFVEDYPIVIKQKEGEKKYYFQPEVFDDFVRENRSGWKISASDSHPKLVLIDIERITPGLIDETGYIVIDVDKFDHDQIKDLFEKIAEFIEDYNYHNTKYHGTKTKQFEKWFKVLIGNKHIDNLAKCVGAVKWSAEIAAAAIQVYYGVKTPNG